jgi:hypothetical protein
VPASLRVDSRKRSEDGLLTPIHALGIIDFALSSKKVAVSRIAALHNLREELNVKNTD